MRRRREQKDVGENKETEVSNEIDKNLSRLMKVLLVRVARVQIASPQKK